MLINDNTQEMNKGLKLLAKSSFVVFIGIFLSKIFTYLYRIIIARNFSPEMYGLFSLALMISGFFLAFSSLGIHSGILRFISFYRGRKQINNIKQILKTSTIILAFSTTLAMLILFFSADFISINIFHNSNLAIFLKIFSFFFPFAIFSGLFLGIMRAYEKIGWYSFIGNILLTFTQLIFIVIFILLGLKKGAIIFSYNLGLLAMLIASFLFCKYKLPEVFGKPKIEKKEKKKIIRELFSYSWPIIFLGLIMSIFSWMDSFAIGFFKTVADVGVYNAAVPIALLLGVIPALFLQLFLPLITKEYSRKNFKLIKELSKQIGKWIFVLNLPFFIIIFLYPGAIINIFFGSAYIYAANSLRMLSVGFFFYSIFILSENFLLMVGKSKIILFNLIIASTVNIILNIILVPRYGINGAAFSTMLSYIILSLLSFFMAKHYTSIVPLKKSIFKIALISSIAILPIFFLKQFVPINLISLLLLGILFILLYFLLIFLTKSLDKNDLMILKTIKKKIRQK